MILKDCSTCMVYDTSGELLVKARVMSVEDRITLHFEDDSKLGPDTEKLEVDFLTARWAASRRTAAW